MSEIVVSLCFTLQQHFSTEPASYLVPTDNNEFWQSALLPGGNCSPDLKHTHCVLETDLFKTKLIMTVFPGTYPTPCEKRAQVHNPPNNSYFHMISMYNLEWFWIYQVKPHWRSVQFSSVTQSRPTLCNPMGCSTPGLPVHHQLPEFTQTHVHRVGDAIQPSHPLLSPSPPAFNLSQHKGLFKWVSSSHQVTKVLELQIQHQSFQWTLRT